MLWHYLGVTLVCLPWWAWVWFVSGEVYLVGSLPAGLRIPAVAAVSVVFLLAVGLYVSGLPALFLASARRRRWTGWLLVTVWTIVMSGLLLTTSVALKSSSLDVVRRYVTGNLAGYTPLWPLLLVAGGYAALKAARGNVLWQFYAAALVVQVPVCLLVTVEGFSLRQFLIPQTLLLCALAAFVVEICAIAVRNRGLSRWAAGAVAISLGVILLLSTIGQVRLLLGEPDKWTSLDRTSRVKPENVRALRGIRRMDRWVAGNVPKGEHISVLELYVNYQVFLDGGQHQWTSLRLDCGVGLRNPTTKGCVPTKAVADAPPKPTVWFSLEEDCKAIALSMPNLSEQLEEANSDYVMLSNNFKYPSILGAASYLVASNAFEIVHEEQLGSAKRTGTSQAIVLLKRTGEPPDTPPTRMDAQSVIHLKKCKATHGPQDWQEVRNEFPDGISLETIPNGDLPHEGEAASDAKARETIKQIYSGN